MYRIFAAALLLTTASAHAAPITIDFEEPISSSVSGGLLTFESKGYWITTAASGTGNYYVSASHLFTTEDSIAPIGGCQCGSGGFTLERADGGAFAVHSAYIDGFAFNGYIEANGVTAAGANVQLSLNSIGSGDWLNLRSFSLGAYAADAYSVRADNIVVSAVPVPAAVWLFGSALTGLGWMKRKRTS